MRSVHTSSGTRPTGFPSLRPRVYWRRSPLALPAAERSRLENLFRDHTQRIDASAAQQHRADRAVFGIRFPDLQAILDAFGWTDQRNLVDEAVWNSGDRFVASSI